MHKTNDPAEVRKQRLMREALGEREEALAGPVDVLALAAIGVLALAAIFDPTATPGEPPPAPPAARVPGALSFQPASLAKAAKADPNPIPPAPDANLPRASH